MSRHAPLVKELADRLRRMDIASVVYFHTDHFEPWRPIGKAPAVGPEIVETIHEFCRATERIDFARRLTLFYKPHLNYALRREGDLSRADPDDLVGFLPRAEHEERYGREAMQEIVAGSSHDIQLHLHHEFYTASNSHTNPEAVAWFASPLGRSLDGQRLELAIRLNREIVARETGSLSPRWFFVHGQWALNGSDHSACTITNEIDILLRNGCRGDFTFPASRPHVNPRIKVPYLCRPFDEAKGYDRPEAEPEIAIGNAAAATAKFFVWASPATSLHCSLDYMSETARRQIDNAEKAAKDLIDNAYVADRRLFIKTHAHSLHAYYFEHARTAVFPHQLPAAQTFLSVIFDAAAVAGLDIEFLTAPEVYDLLIGSETKPDLDLTAAYLGSPRQARRATVAPARPVARERTGASAALAEAPFAQARALELVRETAAEILRRRIETLGIHGSGAEEHYSTMLRQGFPLPAYELVALDILRRQVPGLQGYHEIGSGLGTLSFLLALSGLPAVGIEGDRRRHNTAIAIWRELSSRAGASGVACQLICGQFPQAAAKCDTSRAIAILTDFTTTQTPEQLRAILTGLRGYPYVLIDLQRFCVTREGAESQLELLGELGGQGFVPLGERVEATDCAFVLLQNQAVVPSRRQRPLWSRLMPRRRAGAIRDTRPS